MSDYTTPERSFPCPNCGDPLEYDEVDIGVGTQVGNFRCPACGWFEGAVDDQINDEETPW